jgi:hypothetical protein
MGQGDILLDLQIRLNKMKLKINKLLLSALLFLSLFLLVAIISGASPIVQNTNENTVNQVSAPISNIPDYSITSNVMDGQDVKIGNLLIAESSSKYFSLKKDNLKGSLEFSYSGATNSDTLQLGDFKVDRETIISNIDKGSKVTYISKENKILIDDKSSVDLRDSYGNTLKGITSSEIKIENGSIEYAKFISKNGGQYDITYEGKIYSFSAKQGDTIIFDPKNKKISGSSLSGKDIDFSLNDKNDNSLGYTAGLGKKIDGIKSSNFEIIFDETGNVAQVVLNNGGTYNDLENKLDYSSKDKFSIFFDGREIKDYSGNAVSVTYDENEDRLIESKGTISILDNTNKFNYLGKNSDCYTEFMPDKKYFDVQSGEALVGNGKHRVDIKNGFNLNNANFDFSGEVNGFEVRSSENLQDPKNLILTYEKNVGQNKLRAFAFNDKIGNTVDISSLEDQEQKYLDSVKPLSINEIDEEITYEQLSDNPDKQKLANLFIQRQKNVFSDLSTYGVGQKIFKTSNTGFEILGEITNVDDNGDYVISGGTLGDITLTSSDLANYKVSRFSIGQQVGDLSDEIINSISYDPSTKQFTYQLKDSLTPVTENYVVNEYYGRDYGEARDLYKEMQKDPTLLTKGKLGEALMNQNLGDYNSARTQYYDLINNQISVEEKNLAYRGLIATYISDGNTNMALRETLNAYQINQNDPVISELKKQLTENYLDHINTAISSEDAQILEMWKNKVDYNTKWYEVGLNSPIVSWFSEDIDFATGFSRDSLNEQQKGILAIQNLVDRGYNLNDIQSMSTQDIQTAFNVNSLGIASNIKNSLNSAFQNSDVKNLANGAKTSFNFQNDESYIDKSFLEQGWAEKALSTFNVENLAIVVATEGAGFAVRTLKPSVNGLVDSLRAKSLLNGIADTTRGEFTTLTTTQGRLNALFYDSPSSLNSGVKILTDSGFNEIGSELASGARVFANSNGNLVVAGLRPLEVGGSALQPQLLLAPAKEPLLLTEATTADMIGTSLFNIQKSRPDLITLELREGMVLGKGQGVSYVIDDPKSILAGVDSSSFNSAYKSIYERGSPMSDAEFKSSLIEKYGDVSNLKLSQGASCSGGQCVEKAATFQIYAQENRIESKLIYGELNTFDAVSGEELTSGQHAFNIVNSQGKAYLVDVQNPIVGPQGYVQPYIAPIERIERDGKIVLSKEYADLPSVYGGIRRYSIESPTTFNNWFGSSLDVDSYASGQLLLNPARTPALLPEPEYIWPKIGPTTTSYDSFSYEVVTKGGQPVIKFNNLERVATQSEYGTTDLTIKKGDDVIMTRVLYLDKQEAEKLVHSKDPSLLYSSGLKRANGNWQNAVSDAKKTVSELPTSLRFQNNRDMASEFSYYAQGGADAPGALCASASINNLAVPEFNEVGRNLVVIKLRMPASKLVMPGYSEPYRQLFNRKFNQLDSTINDYGFFIQGSDEGEVVFMGKIPEKYVDSIKVYDRPLSIDEVLSGAGVPLE